MIKDDHLLAALSVIPGAALVRPEGCGHSKLARALTSVQFISVTEVVTKKRNEIFLRRPLKLKFGHAFVVGI